MKISGFFRRLTPNSSALGPRTVALAVLICMAIASVAVIAVQASRIYSLAVSAADGIDVDEADVEVNGLPGTITFLPLVQVFAGSGFDLKGMTSLPPQTPSVSTSEFNLELTGPLLEDGWAFSRIYEDPTISTALIEDGEGNRVVIAATEQGDPAELLSDIEDQFSDMLPLFGFEALSSTLEPDRIEFVLVQEDLDLEAQAWIDPNNPDKLYVGVLLASEDRSQDFDDILALLPR